LLNDEPVVADLELDLLTLGLERALALPAKLAVWRARLSTAGSRTPTRRCR
jgi:hypothetical protein